MSPDPRLTPARKSVYALGDVTINTSLAALSLIYASYFLPQVVDLRAALAGLVPLIARALDAFADPLMGRISDRTAWRSGRRRPWFLIGAIPYGVSFWLLWVDAPFASSEGRFAYYTAIYLVHALSMTVLTVPYMAILPEMATDYDARTSLNTYRTLGSLIGVFAAVAVRPVAEALGGGKEGFAAAGAIFGVLMTLPWIAVHRVTFERNEFRTRPSEQGHFESLRVVFFHRTFLQLTLAYIMGRIAMDLAGALLILYTTFWLLRPDDFELVMVLFLSAVVLALPFWLRLAQGRDKAQVFTIGSLWWALTSLGLVFVTPEWPRWVIFAYVPIVGFGYAVVDLMPWSMLGEVIDQDDLETGERREGLYNGVFTFLRKLGGALGVFFVMSILDLLGYRKGAEQSETAREAIRWMTGAAPAFFLLVGVLLLRAYPLTRRRHDEIVAELAMRDRDRDR
ncbi:MAG: glycoside-pentoside-hexuronide (GPH):cation symporter [Myxococcota bacterium]|nr:glycoside-pentoside-hexuronide (GPH):cation symporter [Myxococcota bacterium]